MRTSVNRTYYLREHSRPQDVLAGDVISLRANFNDLKTSSQRAYPHPPQVVMHKARRRVAKVDGETKRQPQRLGASANYSRKELEASSDAPSQLHVLLEDGCSGGVQRTEVGVFEEPGQVLLGSDLDRLQCSRAPVHPIVPEGGFDGGDLAQHSGEAGSRQ